MPVTRRPPVRAVWLAAATATVALCGLVSPAAGLVSPATGAGSGSVAETTAPAGAVLRVDQLGYAVHGDKIAYLMTSTPAAGAGVSFELTDARGRVVLNGRAGPDLGGWNAAYQAVYPLDFSRLRVRGTFQLSVPALGARSPAVHLDTTERLWGPRVADTIAFFQAQRDGRRVIAGPLNRKPAHLNDDDAAIYAAPTYESADSDVIVDADLRRVGGPVDVAGGWFDAGDFLKFAHTTAYADTLLLIAQRDLGADGAGAVRQPRLDRETRFGLDWLRKAWDPAHGRLVIQVGIGSGNQAGTFLGDHDLWRLPERDDALTGADNRYLAHRPVFVTDARPGRLAPNLAGRLAAAFAVAAQVDAGTHRARARQEYALAADIFARAKTIGVSQGDVVTALPHAFYPESAWRDDLELGAAELALAGARLNAPAPDLRRWLAAGSHWARQYLLHEAGADTLNLYDVGALAHAELLRALPRSPSQAPRPSMSQQRSQLRRALVADLDRQLAGALARSNADPLRAAGNYADFDVASHTFGLLASAALYREVTGSHRYDVLATRQRDWVLGANPWGVSLMIGVGQTFPDCPQHVVANLAGSLDGTRPVLRGAVVNGPNDAGLFADGLGDFFASGRTCPADGVDRYAAFNGRGSAFVDDVRAWQSVEPSLDFTATAALAFALSAH